MTTPEEDFQKTLDDFKKSWEHLVKTANAAFLDAINEATEAMKAMSQRLEDARVNRIVAENPGIDPDEVRASVRRTQGYDYESEGFGGT